MFFFFQAEDGIRDVAVTGVQKCALPISTAPVRSSAGFTPTTATPGSAMNSPESLRGSAPEPTLAYGALTYSGSHAAQPRDRKSTRLNSSHGYISYAVFCLKKKKNTEMQRERMN